MEQTPTPVTVGRLVLYKLSAEDAENINRWPKTAQRHFGNTVQEGDLLPTLVVKVWEGNGINGQVFLDGNDSLWITSKSQGGKTGQWNWMPFQKDQQR